jgi:hypothetical protein
MLQADKQVLLSSVKRNALELRQRELEFHISRYTNLATQASVIAGFSFESLVELEVPEGTPALLSSCYFVFGASAMALALYVLCVASFACVFGHRLALQGPHGSLERAVHILIDHRLHIFTVAGVALANLVGAAVLMAWIKMGAAASAVTLIFVCFAWQLYQRMANMFEIFHIPEEHVVTGAARVQAPDSDGAGIDLSMLNPTGQNGGGAAANGTSAAPAGYARLAEQGEPQDLQSAKQQGHLLKLKSGYFGSERYARRYFVLAPPFLYMFKCWEDFGAGGLRAAMNYAAPIDVRRYDALRTRGGAIGMPNRFDLVPITNPLEKKYELQAITGDEVEDWLLALRMVRGLGAERGRSESAGQASILVRDSTL